MTRSRVRSGIAGVVTAGVLVLAFVVWKPAPLATLALKAESQVKKTRPPGKPIAMPANLVGLEIALGLKDTEPTGWGGEVQVSQGRVLSLDIVRGPPMARVDGTRFRIRSFRRMMQMRRVLVRPVLRASLDAPPTATVTVRTRQGKFEFALKDLAGTTPTPFLDGQATVARQDAALRLTGPDTEDDYPVLARGAHGTAWLAYVEYQPGKPLIRERILAGNFDLLEPKDNGDQVLLVPFDGKAWQPPLEVTGPGLSVWRPAVAVDGQGRVCVAWSQVVDGDWEVFYRRYTPPSKEKAKGEWSDSVRLTRNKGADFHVVAATDAAGTVWLAWQSWQKDNFDIQVAALADNHPWKTPRTVSASKANDWSPAIAADGKGQMFVAWDTYDKGNYDVRLAVIGKDRDPKTITVADSAKFEARPSLACDAAGRLWIAYEEGDEQWGKDWATNEFRKIGLTKNPGAALYLRRTIRVKCLVDGKLMQPAGDLKEAFAGKLGRNKSVPRLGVDAAGGLWLLLRHHPLPGGAGEVWCSYALRYDGKRWSAPRRLPASENLMDNRPALLPLGHGLLAVYSGDGRVRTQNRKQDDLFAAILSPPGATHAVELKADEPAPATKVAAVHPNDAADVARIRAYRVEAGGKKLHLWRGEFHRHTEYSAHRDQDGMLEDAWRYALDAGSLDWIGIGDHDNGFGSEYMWWQFQKMTELHHNPPAFVGVHTYERSVVYPDGHRNVIMPRRGIRPLPRGVMKGTAEKGTPDTKLLYAYLKHFGGMCASHTSATSMGTDWRDNNPEFEPVVEIYQGHRHNYEHSGAPRSATAKTQIGGYRPAGYVWNAFEKGYKFGFQASSDHMSTHMSYAVVLTDDLSPRGLIAAFKKRHCYAATDNIIVDVRCGDHLMGDEFTTAKRPTLTIKVYGTAPVAKLHVIRDNKYVYTTEPKTQEVKLSYTDMDAAAGKSSYYYVRLEQADGNIAWASPMWITYKP
jgi:hypothetical protein